MLNTFNRYKQAGLSCLPCKKDKSPFSSKSWLDDFEESDFVGTEYIGIKGGNHSGGLICMDFDNHQKDATTNLKNYIEIPEVKEIYDKYKLPIETTQSGGYHLLFRSDLTPGNKKLAGRMFEGKPDWFIEIKAQNGYFLCAPSPGYRVRRNDILIINKLNSVDTAILIDNALSMNEIYTTRKISEYEGSERPGDKFNKEATKQEVESILSKHGWKNVGNKKFRRPGKKAGISASLNNINGCYLFYCFTANGSPFEEREAYTPFQVRALLDYNGDFKECALSLPKPERITQKVQLKESELEKILNKNLINPNEKIEKPPIILSVTDTIGQQIKHKRLFTLGNFSVIMGKAKSKKTHLLTLLTSAMLKKKNVMGKFVQDLPEKKNLIVWFDTEQGKYDSQVVIRKIIKMSDNGERLIAFNLRPFTPAERCQIIDFALKKYGNETGFCVIDGIQDLATAINDELEATRVSSLMLNYTAIYNFHLSIVIHQNKNDNFATGHLGSSLMKKAEVIISTNKIKDSYDAMVVCEMIRGTEGFEPFVFSLSEEGLPYVNDIATKENGTINFYEQKEKLIDYSKPIHDLF